LVCFAPRPAQVILSLGAQDVDAVGDSCNTTIQMVVDPSTDAPADGSIHFKPVKGALPQCRRVVLRDCDARITGQREFNRVVDMLKMVNVATVGEFLHVWLGDVDDVEASISAGPLCAVQVVELTTSDGDLVDVAVLAGSDYEVSVFLFVLFFAALVVFSSFSLVLKI
jgi:hypothetical protein